MRDALQIYASTTWRTPKTPSIWKKPDSEDYTSWDLVSESSRKKYIGRDTKQVGELIANRQERIWRGGGFKCSKTRPWRWVHCFKFSFKKKSLLYLNWVALRWTNSTSANQETTGAGEKKPVMRRNHKGLQLKKKNGYSILQLEQEPLKSSGFVPENTEVFPSPARTSLVLNTGFPH